MCIINNTSWINYNDYSLGVFMASPVSNNNPAIVTNGRSADADLIYQQYLTYYNDVNNKINTLNQITINVNQAARAQDITLLVNLQKQLYTIYQSQYNNSSATLNSFKAACASINNQVSEIYSVATSAPSSTNSSSNSSPISVFTSGATTGTSGGSTGTTGTGSTGSTGTTTGGTGTSGYTGSTTGTSSSSGTKNTGRSPDASLIYTQYVDYYNDINTKINAIAPLPNATQNRQALLALQQQLYPIYTSQYSDSTKTLSTFKDACAAIEAQVAQIYNSARGINTGTTGTENTGGSTGTTGTGGTTGTTGTGGTTGTTGVTSITQGSSAANKIENGTWYIDWTSWNAPVPQGVNAVNIFVGNMFLDANGNPAVGGFGTMSQNQTQMVSFIQACHAQGMSVKISLGGGGGSYDNTWDVLTNNNVQGFAQALANFCTTNGLDGVDFDCEEFTSAQDKPVQQALVGTLIKDFKTINPNFQTSLDTNAGFGPNFPWQGIVQNIMNASLYTDPTTGKTVCGVDRLNIMAYFNSMSDEQGWVTGWANWLKNNYNFASSQITVGLDPAAGAYNSNSFAAWAAQQGYSTYLWDYDPANPSQSNQIATGILNAYNNAKAA